ncbi:MAG: response regulator [Oscillospiraceae bacterium]|nr:response regulator [Oscillospiraceae bacterium]
MDIFLRLVFEYTPDTILIMDRNFKYIIGTKNSLGKIGINTDILAGKTFEEITASVLTPDMLTRATATLKNVAESGETVKYNNYEMKLGGKTYVFEIFVIPLKNDGGETIGIMLTMHNTTELNQAIDTAERSSRAKSNFLAKMSHEIRTPMNAIIGMSELILRDDISKDAREHVLGIKHASANLMAIINDILDFSKIESGKMEIIPIKYALSSLINDVIEIIRTRVLDKPILFSVNVNSDIPDTLTGDEVRVKQMLLNLLSNACKYCDRGFIKLSIDREFIDDDTVLLIFEVADSGIGIKEEDIHNLFGDFVQIDMIKNRSVEGTGLGLAITRSFCRAMGGDVSVSSVYGEGSVFKITVPQKYENGGGFKRFALVEDKEKSVLIYETRDVFAQSISAAMENLGVKYKLVNNQSRFLAEMEENDYDFFFVSSFLLDGTGKIIKKLERDIKIALISEYGENSIETENVKTLFMPAHAADIADILNNRAKSNEYRHKRHSARFIAPTAKILIVDDINTNLVVAEGLLLPYKMQIDLCKSGKEAIEMVKINQYDIVFMDHMMPEMDGIEATIKIRALNGDGGEYTEDYYKNLPVIALTANAVSGMREMFLENGFQDFLAKPIDINKLDGVLETWLPKEKRETFEESDAPAGAGDSPAFRIEGIDVEAGVYMTGGSAKNYLKTLGIFREDGLEKIKTLRYCVETNNFPLYATHVHALKSASASIGASNVSNMARSLETAAKNNDKSFVSKNTEKFIDELNLLFESIRLAISSALKEKKQSDTINADFITETAVKLKDALRILDMEAVDAAVSVLRTEAGDGDISKIVEEISNNILICEYDKADELTEKLFAMI